MERNGGHSAAGGWASLGWPFRRAQQFGWHWLIGLLGLMAVSIVVVGAPAPTGMTSALPSGATSQVVVLSAGHVRGAVTAVQAVGGHVDRRLGIVGGVSASVPTELIGALRGAPGVLSVTADEHLEPMSVVPSLGYDPSADFGSMSQVTRLTGAQAAWAAGYTGTGVDVALIDTGVARVTGTGTTINGPDLSFDYQGGYPAGVDAYGHGTHLAGIINGKDPTATASATGCTSCLNSSGYSDTNKFVGMAPGARVVNVKVGSFDGGADVSQLIAAIDWVVKNKTANGMNIKIINLSFGTISANPYTTDPLAYATEIARTKGLLVIAAGGNDGDSTVAGLSDPAYDPYVLAVGAEDPMGTTTITDDIVPSWASHGTAGRPVDVVAPGTHIISLRVPGSYADVNYGSTARVGTGYFRASGTSQSSAVVSGLAALLYQRYPTATPDRIKKLLMNTASKLTSSTAGSPNYWGKGIVNGATAITTALPSFTQSFTNGTGTGAIESTRGGVRVISGGVELSGEKSIFYNTTWSSSTWASKCKGLTSWSTGLFLGQRWTGDTWTGTSYNNAKWTLNDWANRTWASHAWSPETWDGTQWVGTWSGDPWAGHRWRSGVWSSYSWG